MIEMNNAKSRLKQITRGRQNSNHARFNIIFGELRYLQGALADAQSDLKQNCVADLAPPIENLIEVIGTLISELQIKAKGWGQELTFDQKFLKMIALEYSNFAWMFDGLGIQWQTERYWQGHEDQDEIFED